MIIILKFLNTKIFQALLLMVNLFHLHINREVNSKSQFNIHAYIRSQLWQAQVIKSVRWWKIMLISVPDTCRKRRYNLIKCNHLLHFCWTWFSFSVYDILYKTLNRVFLTLRFFLIDMNIQIHSQLSLAHHPFPFLCGLCKRR